MTKEIDGERRFLGHVAMNVREKFLEILGSESRGTFLVSLGNHLGISMRDILREGGSGDLRQARACNEIMIAIWSQVGATIGGSAAGYPDSEFISILMEKADMGNARHHLRNAIEGALLVVESAEGTQ